MYVFAITLGNFIGVFDKVNSIKSNIIQNSIKSY